MKNRILYFAVAMVVIWGAGVMYNKWQLTNEFNAGFMEECVKADIGLDMQAYCGCALKDLHQDYGTQELVDKIGASSDDELIKFVTPYAYKCVMEQR